MVRLSNHEVGHTDLATTSSFALRQAQEAQDEVY